jgi:hypothetical protein
MRNMKRKKARKTEREKGRSQREEKECVEITVPKLIFKLVGK